jgi:uncharacterized protein YjiS (DUF1127 family)
MLTDDDEIDLCPEDYRALTPAEREAFKRRVIQRANAERDAVIRATFRRIWSMLPNTKRFAQAAAAVRRMWTAYRENRKRKVAVYELLSLDDHMLKDMGLSRSEVIAVVYAESNSRLPPGMTSQKGRDRVDACVSPSSARVPRVSISPI